MASSIVAYFFGEFSNSYVLSKMKIMTKGKYLWTRTIGSTVIGQLVDTFIFIGLAFGGSVPIFTLFIMILAQYFGKVLYEIILTPITYLAIKRLKRVEGTDVFDEGISYNHFVQ